MWKSITDEMDPVEISYREGVMDALDILKDMMENSEEATFEDAIEAIEDNLLGHEGSVH